MAELLRLHIHSAGLWRIAGTDLWLSNLLSPGPDWEIETSVQDTLNWLMMNRLAQPAAAGRGVAFAHAPTRGELLRAISAAAANDPPPHAECEFADTELVRRPDGSYTDRTVTFRIWRDADSTGIRYWWMCQQDPGRELPGGTWDTSTRTLREIRERLHDYYTYLEEERLSAAIPAR